MNCISNAHFIEFTTLYLMTPTHEPPISRLRHCISNAYSIVAVCCSVLQCGAVWCSVVQCGAVCCSVVQCGAVWCSVVQCVAVCCSVLQCVAVCCSVLQCVAVWNRFLSGIAAIQDSPMSCSLTQVLHLSFTPSCPQPPHHQLPHYSYFSIPLFFHLTFSLFLVHVSLLFPIDFFHSGPDG